MLCRATNISPAGDPRSRQQVFPATVIPMADTQLELQGQAPRDHLRGRHPGGEGLRHRSPGTDRAQRDRGDARERRLDRREVRDLAPCFRVGRHDSLHHRVCLAALLRRQTRSSTRAASTASSICLSILPTYLSLIIPGAQSFMVIRALRLLRVFRVLKLAHFVGEASRTPRRPPGQRAQDHRLSRRRSDPGRHRRFDDVSHRGRGQRLHQHSGLHLLGRSSP